MNASLVDALFAAHGVAGPWVPLPITGLANRIYATREVVLRLATDHPDAIVDARTESVAAPAARAAGILTPRLVAFDDSRTLVDRPFSLWERVHADTLGLAALNDQQRADAWRGVGRELARLHLLVSKCADPQGYLDDPTSGSDLDAALKPLVDAAVVAQEEARAIQRLAAELEPHVTATRQLRFIHNDAHAMNVMCSPSGELRALIDWGDAGWGDPAQDFAAIPFDAIPFAREAYELEAPGLLGEAPEARVIWDKLLGALEDARDSPDQQIPIDAFRRFLDTGWPPVRG